MFEKDVRTTWLETSTPNIQTSIVSAGVQKETVLQGLISEDFRPVVEWREWGSGDGPELAQGMMDECLVGAMAQEVDLVVGVDAAF